MRRTDRKRQSTSQHAATHHPICHILWYKKPHPKSEKATQTERKARRKTCERRHFATKIGTKSCTLNMSHGVNN